VTEPARAGDLARLNETALAQAGDYVALAALARQTQNGGTALTALSQYATDEDAFAWVWALTREQDYRWSQVQLPSGTAVPERLTEQVKDWILTAADPRGRGGYAQPHETHAPRLLAALGATPFGLDVAKGALTMPGTLSPDVRGVAQQVAGVSDDPGARAAVIRDVEEEAPHKRAVKFRCLHPQYAPSEVEALVRALSLTTDRALEESDWPVVAEVASRLADDVLGAWLEPDWVRRENKDKIVGPLLSHLGLERARRLLEHGVGEQATRRLLEHAANHQDGAAEDLAEYAFGAFPDDWCHALWNGQVRHLEAARQMGYQYKPRDSIISTLWRFVVAAHDDGTGRDLAAILEPGELTAAAAERADQQGPAARVGAVAAALLGGAAGRTWETETVEAAMALGGAADGYWEGLAGALPPGAPLPNAVAAGAAGSAQAFAAFAAAGLAGQVVPLVTEPRRAAAALAAAHERLSDDEATVLLAAAGWTATDVGYPRLVDTLAGRLPVLAQELHRAVDSLDGPEAAAVPPDVIAHLLTVALAAGLRDELGATETTVALRALLRLADDTVLEQACAWVRALDLDTDGACDHGRVMAVVGADDDRGGRVRTIAVLRTDLADRLAALAQDTGRDTTMRVADLELAVTVAPAAARAAALTLADARNSTVSAAAAAVLARTPGDPHDLPRLDALLGQETRVDIASQLRRARQKISSGDIGTALAALVDLLGLPDDLGHLDPDVLVPDPAHRERFVDWVDKARARADNDHDPGTFVEAAINIADQMVDLVLLAAGPGSKLKDPELQAIRDNSPARIDTGQLLGRQQLQQMFTWFPVCLTLRRKRGAHPSPSGSTLPNRLQPDALLATMAELRDITSAWIEDMHRQRAGDGT